jgi:hypothetical protein
MDRGWGPGSSLSGRLWNSRCTVIAEALEAGTVRDAVIAQSQREVTELWAVRDSPGECQKAGHWPQLSFDVSVPTGEIGDLVGPLSPAGRRAHPPRHSRARL